LEEEGIGRCEILDVEGVANNFAVADTYGPSYPRALPTLAIALPGAGRAAWYQSDPGVNDA